MTSTSRLHSLLLLSDSALPLGSFAFSSGLESFLAHRHSQSAITKTQSFAQFLDHSLLNTSSTALPFVLAGYRDPTNLERYDDEFDASTTCTVARRASITQGKALLAVWERALSAAVLNEQTAQPEISLAAEHMTAFAQRFKTLPKPRENEIPALQGHLAPLFGVACRALDLSLDDTAYVFLLNHAKAVLSAAVRSSVFGPYQSQMILAGEDLQNQIRGLIEKFKDVSVDNVAVAVPLMDLWMGRHELLYSRIFNS